MHNGNEDKDLLNSLTNRNELQDFPGDDTVFLSVTDVWFSTTEGFRVKHCW